MNCRLGACAGGRAESAPVGAGGGTRERDGRRPAIPRAGGPLLGGGGVLLAGVAVGVGGGVLSGLGLVVPAATGLDKYLGGAMELVAVDGGIRRTDQDDLAGYAHSKAEAVVLGAVGGGQLGGLGPVVALENSCGRSGQRSVCCRGRALNPARGCEAGIMTASVSVSASGIFISYRRDDAAYPAGWLFDRLVDHYSNGQVFKDVDSIQPGDDFAELVTAALGSCAVVLAAIGTRWLTITDDDGRRRL
jgi:hypothetical protein